MDEKDLATLIEGEDTPAPEAQATPPEAPAPEPAANAPARGPDGKFAAKATEAPPQAEPPPPAPPTPEPGHVPISAMLDEREKRQALEKRLADIETKQREAQAKAEATDLPADVRNAQQLWAVRMDLSRELLASQIGEAEVEALHQWGFEKCGSDPLFNQQVLQSKNPYAFLRQARQREQLLAEVSPDDLEDYKAWKASKAAAKDAGETPALRVSTPLPAPPRSLANAPNAGGAGAVSEVPMGPGAAFASAIRR